MAISTNGTVIARLAGGLYNTVLSNGTYNDIAKEDPSALANTLYARDFAKSTDLAVATTLVTNLGLSSVAGLANWVAAQLTAAGAANKGAKVVSLLNDFAGMTADATYGAQATAFNTKVDAALAASQKAGSVESKFADAGVVAVTGATFTLTTGVDTFAGTAVGDTFNATHLTLTGNDDIRGGDGSDTLVIIDTGATPFTPNTSIYFDSIETVKIQNMNGAGASGTAGVTEKTSVTFPALASGKTLIINGITLTATGADLPAETVAAAFLNGSTSSTGFSANTTLNSFGATYTNATAAVLTGTATSVSILNGALNTVNGTSTKVWSAAAGADSKTLTFTSAITNSNVADLAITGTAGTATPAVSTYTFSVNPTTLSYLSFNLNGNPVVTGVLAADTPTGAAAKFAAAINAAAGSTVAVATAADVVVTGSYIIGPVQTIVAATQVLAATQVQVSPALTTAAVTAPPVVTTQGAAETFASYTQGGIDTFTASKFTGTTSFVNDASTSGVKISSLSSTQVPTIQGDNTTTIGSNEFGYTSVASPVLNIQGGGTSGALTTTGTSTTAATINVKDAPKTTAGATGTQTVGATSLWADATSTTGTLTINTTNSNFTTGALTTSAATINLTGNGAVTFGSTSTPVAIVDANLLTVDASGMTTGGIFFKAPTSLTTFKGGAGADTFVTSGTAFSDSAVTSIDGGAGTDTLQLATIAEGNTVALAARFTGFETLKTPGSMNMDLYPSITAVTPTATGAVLTNVNATQAAAIRQQDTSAGLTISLKDTSGLADVVKLSTSTTSTSSSGSAVSVTGLVISGVETLNFTNGSTALTGASTLSFGGTGSTGLTTLTASGSKPMVIDLAASTTTPLHATTLTTIDLSGISAQATGTNTLTLKDTVGGHALTNGLTITTTAGDDVISLGGTTGTNTLAAGVVATINAGAGNDNVTVSLGQLYTPGSGNLVVNGGTNGSVGDTLTISDATAGTVSDGTFARVTGFENLALSSTGAYNLTTGGFFSTAFPTGVTITGAATTTSAVTLDAGLYQSAVKFTNVGTTGVQTVTGSSQADTITITSAVAGTGASTVVINGGAGIDTITVTDASIIAADASFSISGGAGADKITLALTHTANAFSYATIGVAVGDSLPGAADSVTGFYVAAGATHKSDVIAFPGTAILPVVDIATTAFSGKALSELNYSVENSTGLITIGGTAAATVTAAMVESMFANQLSYQLASTETVFWKDTSNTYVFNHNVLGDSQVTLVGTTSASTLATTNAATSGLLMIS